VISDRVICAPHWEQKVRLYCRSLPHILQYLTSGGGVTGSEGRDSSWIDLAMLEALGRPRPIFPQLGQNRDSRASGFPHLLQNRWGGATRSLRVFGGKEPPATEVVTGDPQAGQNRCPAARFQPQLLHCDSRVHRPV